MAYSSLLLLGLCDNIRGPLFPEILKSFPVSDTMGSLFFSLSSVMGIIGAGGSRFFIMRFKEMGSLRISILMFVVGLSLMSIAQTFSALLFGILFFGFSMGLMAVIQNMLIVNEFPPGPTKSKIISGLHSMYAASSLGAPLIISGLAMANSSFEIWRLGFFAAAVICLFVFLLTFSFLKFSESPPSPEAMESLPHPEDLVVSRDAYQGHRRQIYFAVILSSYVLAEILVSSRMALYIRRVVGGDLQDSNLYTALFFVFLFLSRFLFAAWSPKIALSTQLKGSLVLSLCSVLAGIFVHPFGLSLAGFFMGPFYPLMILEIGTVFNKQVKEAISWAVSLSSVFVVSMHFGVGFISESWGLKAAFMLGPVFLVIAFLMLVIYEKILRRV